MNPAALSFFGPHIVGRHWGDVAHDYLEPTLTVGEWLCGSGRVSIAESALPSAGGKILLVHDVTAAHQMKTELERNQRLAAMGEMAASLAYMGASVALSLAALIGALHLVRTLS